MVSQTPLAMYLKMKVILEILLKGYFFMREVAKSIEILKCVFMFTMVIQLYAFCRKTRHVSMSGL